MDLTTWSSNTPGIRMLSSKDESDVERLLMLSPMNVGGMKLTYDRSPNYSALLKCQGRKYGSLVAEDKDRLIALVSFSTSQKWINQKLENCAYIGDFRTDRSRKAAAVWRKYYPEILNLLRQDEEYSAPKYFLTGVLKKNFEAINNLASQKKDFGFRYDFLTETKMVNVFAKWLPTFTKVRTLRAKPSDLNELKNFLDRSERQKLFGANFSEAEDSDWNYREKTWPGFKVENFLIQKNHQGIIVACTLPWDPGFAKRMTVERAPKFAKLALKILRLIGYASPKEGQSIKTLYLTHLNVESDFSQSIKSFINYSLKNYQSYSMISFRQDQNQKSLPAGFISQTISVLLYRVALSSEPPLRTSSGESIGFEMAIV